MATIGTFNEEGVNVDLMIPRKCNATNTLINSFDHSAVQIAIANVSADGTIDGTTTTFCITGYLRSQGESDHAINHLAIERGIIHIKAAKPKKAKTTKGKNAKGGDKNKKNNKNQKGAKPAAAAKPAGAKPAQKGAKPARKTNKA
ncbi:small subunit ribosomal protein S21e [Angomonas deanei]|uniref:Ribosomal protein S21e, putative n=1 Tax=Angomonas deanei TaxID=59799 RepID=A0A7G2CSQ4_9TRYP|nr:small subunit ribosomal protein S21e [Angomonas deanei]CAD2222788.1 Ribosomal protein S21e, putative [Angomonas deanei]CAD2222789.1 Ribosomal protein S21e, putative [Angomonas deanei]CAD2222790.1 Ribosomal protein S21e, putative [Angomonas deanei]|eukprot:EPY18007.1 small subunit ribosomal protein S21e [Angomonas deanei]